MATFNISSQNAANIQNIGGDAVIHGGVHGHATFDQRELRVAIARAREHVADMELPPEVRAPVDLALASAAEEAAQPQPDKGRVASFLGTAARTLKEAGDRGNGRNRARRDTAARGHPSRPSRPRRARTDLTRSEKPFQRRHRDGAESRRYKTDPLPTQFRARLGSDPTGWVRTWRRRRGWCPEWTVRSRPKWTGRDSVATRLLQIRHISPRASC